MSIKMKDQSKRKRPSRDDVPAAKRPKADFKAKGEHKGPSKAPEKQPVKLLSKREQKDAKKEKKLKFKKNFATIQETVLLWEELRPKQTTKEQKQQLVAQIVKKVVGNVMGLANHHSASRVIQWCMKEGSDADKAAMTAEVRANIVPLSKSKYGRHVVQKLINIAPKEDVPDLVKLFKGHVAELLRHPCGADVLDDLYNVSTPTCRNTLCAELYGREFSLFGGVSTQGESISHLSQLLAGVDSSKRQAILQALYKGLAPVLEKALLHPVMTHRLLRELLTEASGSVVADVVDTLAATGGNALKLVHTHDGAAAAAMALAYGTPKDRKRLVKGMKGFVWQTAENEWGHAVIATALSVTDDTALTGKSILGELKGHLEEMLTNKHAHRVLMQLLAPDSHRYLPPAIYEIMHPPAKTMMMSAAAAAATGTAGAGLDEDEEEPDFVGGADADFDAEYDADGDADGDADFEQQEVEGSGSEDGSIEGEKGDSGDEGEQAGSGSEGDGEAAEAAGSAGQQANGSEAPMVAKQLGESKKDPLLRRQELLGSGPDSLGAVLVGLCAEHAVQLLSSPVGSEVIVEVARGAAGGLLWQQHQAGVQAVHEAIVQQLQQDVAALSSSSGQQQPKQKGKRGKGSSSEAADAAEPLLTHYFGSRALRRLLLAAGSEGAEGAAARAFAEQLWQQVLQGQCKHLVGGHAEKVVAGVLHCNVQSVVQAASAELRPLVGGDVQRWAAKFVVPPGQQQHGKQHKQVPQHEQQQAAGKLKGAGSKQQQEQAPHQQQQQQSHKKKHKKH